MASDYLMSSELIIQQVDRMVLNQELSWVKNHQRQMPRRVFRESFQTVQVSLPRGAGHTTAAAALWMRYDALVFFPSYRLAREFLHNELRGRVAFDKRHPEVNLSSVRLFSTEFRHGAIDEFKKQTWGVPESYTPQLIVFDMYSQCISPPPMPDDITVRMMSVEELTHLCNQLMYGQESVAEEITDFAFDRFPSIKGVVRLQ